MPEGDTIHRAAHTLHRALAGSTITGARSRDPGLDLSGVIARQVPSVEARGKNLLIHFDNGLTLLTHMRMTGSWHLYRPGEPWGKPPRQATVILETAVWVAVAFNVPVGQLLTSLQLKRQPRLARLGPDVLTDDFDLGEAVRRLRQRGGLAIGEALLAQSALAGIGNIYKCESLFLARVNPWTAVDQLPDAQLTRLVNTARGLMRSNLNTGPRTTRTALDRRRTWVYGRSGRPCRRCGTTVTMRRQGLAARSTYWCEACQETSGSHCA